MDDRRRDALNLERIAERGERADDIFVERHMSERPIVLSCEIEVREAHGVAHVPVHDRHREDGLSLGLDRLPAADALDEAPRPFGDCDRAQGRRARAGRKRRIDERDRNAAPRRLLDRGRQRKAGRARAGDDDVEDGSRFARGSFQKAAHCRTFAARAQSVGAARRRAKRRSLIMGGRCFQPAIARVQRVAKPFPAGRDRLSPAIVQGPPDSLTETIEIRPDDFCFERHCSLVLTNSLEKSKYDRGADGRHRG